MAKALERRLASLRKEAQTVARIGCVAVDTIRHGEARARVEMLENAQNYLRACLLETEGSLRDWPARSQRRRTKIRRVRDRSGASPLIGEHIDAANALGMAWAFHRQMIRQLGDGLAWAVLRESPRIIAPLYATRTHHLTPEAGLIAASQVISDAHSTGELLALDNDLTRCLGIGDLTIVASDNQWSMPLLVECKTAVLDKTGGRYEVSVNMGAPLSEDPLHKRVYEEFCRAVNATVGRDGRPVFQHEAKQETEMQERAETVFRSLIDRPRSLSGTSHWSSMRKVLSRAAQNGGAYDLPERGLAYLAVRHREGDNPEEQMSALLARLQEDGFPAGESVLTVDDFANDDHFSAVVPPVALWPLPLDQRISLLTGRIFVACVFRRDLWDMAFGQFGLTASREGKKWIVHGHGSPVVFDPLERVKLQLGIAFSGISPRGVAEAIAELMNEQREPD